MVLFQSSSDPKYQLLENPRKQWGFVAHSWAIFGFVVLSVSITLISLIVIWDQIRQMQHETQTLDFVLFGPKRDISDLIRVSEHRALTYSLAINETRHNFKDFPFTTNESFEMYRHTEEKYSLVCYYVIPGRSSLRDRLQPSDIDPQLCTHIIIFFASIEESTINFTDTQLMNAISELKQKNPELKLLLSVVSVSSSEDTFAAMVSSATSRQKFVKSALQLLRKYSLDGIDLDWEFPAWPPKQNAYQKGQFIELLKEMRLTFGNEFLISVAVAAPLTIITRAYDVPQMALYVDFVNIMCYDYHTFVWYFPYTGPNAPLLPNADDLGYEKSLNTNYTVNVWIHGGMPKKKIMVGVPIYGHSWTLQDATKHDFGDPADGFGSIGEKGFISYRDVCKFLNTSGVERQFNSDMKVPYAYLNREWFSYDDELSVSDKAKYVKKMGVGGVMVFSLNQDDIHGSICPSRVSFPLVNSLKTVLLDNLLPIRNRPGANFSLVS